MRTITIDNSKLKAILEERAVIYEEIGEINKKIVELDKERTKQGYKMDRLKEKTQQIMEKIQSRFELKEFEFIARVSLANGGEPTIEILDKVEEYIKALREDANKKEKPHDNDASK
jgi:septation ring formation regulator EzrA